MLDKAMLKGKIKALINRKNLITVFILAITFGGMYLTFSLIKSKYSFAYIVSGSMEPTYYRGDFVILEICDPATIKLGDVIVFRSPENPSILILHRVVAIKKVDGKYYFLTKGDNPITNIRVDRWGWVSEDYLYGKMIYRIPFFGLILEVLNVEIIRILSIGLLLLILLSILFQEDKRVHVQARVFKNRKAIFGILLIGGLLATALFYSCSLSPDINVTVDKVYGLEDSLPQSTSKLHYLSVVFKITCHGLWWVSIRGLNFTLLYHNGTIVSNASWNILYMFYGSKKVSIFFMLNEKWWEIFQQEGVKVFLFKIRVSMINLLGEKQTFSATV